MLVSKYAEFVEMTDSSKKHMREKRLDIGKYGLVSEVGSVVAAVKKLLLSQPDEVTHLEANDEIIEELGDSLWYCFSLTQAANDTPFFNFFAFDIANLCTEVGADDERAQKIEVRLLPGCREKFLHDAQTFLTQPDAIQFEDYQDLAFLTARHQGTGLIEVCLALLEQLSAELIRPKLPDFEKELNANIADRELNVIVGEIAWHLSALAKAYGVSLSEIAEENEAKLRLRYVRGLPTPLYDESDIETEKFPRNFEISFISIGPKRCRMYYKGKPLGDDLTDNSRRNDGYRFHDIMHLANVAKLGWSPVLRKLMGLKRKSKPSYDEVEDGARAAIVEEAVIKAIHSEGTRISKRRDGNNANEIAPLFKKRTEISFSFLKFTKNLVDDLEVRCSKYWEWEDAIIDGHEIYYKLRCENQGTVTVNLYDRSLTFRPEVCIDASGAVRDIGAEFISKNETIDPLKGALTEGELQHIAESATARDFRKLYAQKCAILKSLGIEAPSIEQCLQLTITQLDRGRISVKAIGEVQDAVWANGIICFKTSFVETEDGVNCTALALADSQVR